VKLKLISEAGLGLALLCALVVVPILQPKPYRPTGPDPDADSPIVILQRIDADSVQCKAKPTCVWKRHGDGHTATFHLELTTVCPAAGADKTYVSREATVDAAKDQSGEVGAALLVMMANEIVAAAGKDGFEMTPKALLQSCNMEEVK